MELKFQLDKENKLQPAVFVEIGILDSKNYGGRIYERNTGSLSRFKSSPQESYLRRLHRPCNLDLVPVSCQLYVIAPADQGYL
jgi:hypothetical protein